jgi:hypothetical protein
VDVESGHTAVGLVSHAVPVENSGRCLWLAASGDGESLGHGVGDGFPTGTAV